MFSLNNLEQKSFVVSFIPSFVFMFTFVCLFGFIFCLLVVDESPDVDLTMFGDLFVPNNPPTESMEQSIIQPGAMFCTNAYFYRSHKNNCT